MKRLIGGMFAVLLVATALSVAAGPASAHPGACVGNGTVTTAQPVYFPTFGPSASGSLSISFVIGGCLEHYSSNMSAAFTPHFFGNSCLSSEGEGTIDGHSFKWLSLPSLLLFQTGSPDFLLDGVMSFVPDWTVNSCTTGATRFIITGAVVIPGA